MNVSLKACGRAGYVVRGDTSSQIPPWSSRSREMMDQRDLSERGTSLPKSNTSVYQL